jgi:UbiD family decarboxylase
MPFSDLREFVNKLDEADELARVHKEVDPKYEVGAICKTIHDKGRQALFFEKVRGCSMPVATELLGTFKRIAIAIDADEKDLFTEVMERTKRSIEPTIVSDGPCKEIILKGNDVDLDRLPWITWNKTEKAPYITDAVTLLITPSSLIPLHSEGVTAKLFVDATKSKDFRSEGLALPPEDVWQKVKANWDSYFVA